MAKLELSRVLGHYVESIKADKVTENGALVGKGKLVEGEDRLYEAVEATADNCFLVSTPEVHFENSSKSWDYTNKKGEVMRAHQLEIGDTVTVEQAVHNTGLNAGDALTVTGGKFAKGEGNFVLDRVVTLGIDRRPAYQIRKIK